MVRTYEVVLMSPEGHRHVIGVNAVSEAAAAAALPHPGHAYFLDGVRLKVVKTVSEGGAVSV